MRDRHLHGAAGRSQFGRRHPQKLAEAGNNDTSSLGTGNYPGDPHCKLDMLDSKRDLDTFKKKLERRRLLHQRAELPRQPASSEHGDRQAAPRGASQDRPSGRGAGRAGRRRLQRLPRRFARGHGAELGDLPLAARLSRHAPLAVGRSRCALLDRERAGSRPTTASRSPSRCIRASSSTAPRRCSSCGVSPAPRSAPTSIRATSSGKGIDPIAAIRVLGDAIYYVHAKDTQIFTANLPKTGVLDTKPYTDERDRGWIFRTCGYGHGETGGGSSSRRCGCSATTTCCRSSTKTACCPPRRDSPKRCRS